MKTIDIKTALRSYLDHIYADYCKHYSDDGKDAVSYTHLTLPTNREV